MGVGPRLSDAAESTAAGLYYPRGGTRGAALEIVSGSEILGKGCGWLWGLLSRARGFA